MSVVEYTKTSWLSKGEDGSIPDNAPAINAGNLNHIEDGIEKCVNAINDLDNSQKELKDGIPNLFKREPLWSNEDTTKDQSQQTISIDLSEYVRFMVLCKTEQGEEFYTEHHISYKGITIIIPVYDSNGYIYYRHINFTDNNITISDMYRGNSKYPSYNEYGVVVKIYGYKN